MTNASLNCAYRLVWSEVQNAYVVVSEITKGRGKKNSAVTLLASAVLSLLSGLFGGNAFAQQAPPAALALPSGANVVSGTASFQQTANSLTVNQSTDRLITNWQTFNIGTDAGVRFNQPGSRSIALNRVLSNDPSYIYGALSSNGQVFLINPSGVLFGQSARVDVGGLVASSLGLADGDFLAGRYQFSGNGGFVTNAGQIRTADGGYVAFIAPQVANSGSISAPAGSVVLAAGSQVNLDFNGDKLINFTVARGAVDALADNSGSIHAEGGAITLSARAADALTQSVVTSASALVLNAGLSAAAGTVAGGNLVFSGSAGISIGAGGTGKLYTGSISGSTGVTARVGSGSGRFRYNSDETTTNYTTAVGGGVNAIYREQPTVSVGTGNQTAVYGATTTNAVGLSGNVNGDTAAQIFATAAVSTSCAPMPASRRPAFTVACCRLAAWYLATTRSLTSTATTASCRRTNCWCA